MIIPRSVLIVRGIFRECILKKDIDGIVSLYKKNAVLKGTFSQKTVRGHEPIRKYFIDLTKRGAEDVRFDSSPTIFTRKEIIFVSGKYKFKMSDKNWILASYQLVIDNGKILSHFSSLTQKDG